MAGLTFTPGPDAWTRADLAVRVSEPQFSDWWQQVTRTGYCLHPIRLQGRTTTVDGASGEIVDTWSSDNQPDGVSLKACGNRRAAVCPNCSATYRADTWQLIAAGLRGGKGVPDTVDDHPRVFVTLTAPSFGAVHSQRRQGRKVRTCRPNTGKGRHHCPHGRPLTCHQMHRIDDPALGQPLCAECFDYPGAVLWNAHAPDLWRRTTITLRRTLARFVGLSERQLHQKARVSFTKVAEYQARGVIHLHVVVRLDGAPPDNDPTVVVPPPDGFDADLLGRVVAAALPGISLPAPDIGDGRERIIRWGDQIDIRTIHVGSDVSNPEAVAAYVAKYSTKSAETLHSGLEHRLRSRCDIETRELTGHIRRLVETAWDLGSRPDLTEFKLRRWAHMLGFRGHFASRSRRYSTTLKALRTERQKWARARADGADVDRSKGCGEDTTLVVGRWIYSGTGHRGTGDDLLVRTAARDRVRALRLAAEQRKQERVVLRDACV